MKTPITYYGGKQRIATEIIDMIPEHRIYVEPFFGGGAVFFQKQKSFLEVINDHDYALINFYRCVQDTDQFERLYRMVQQTLHSEVIHRHAYDYYKNPPKQFDEVVYAWAIWLLTNGSYAATMGGGWKWDNGTSGGHAGNSLMNKREQFTRALHERLESVQISCKDAIHVIQNRDSPVTFFYLDPPYPDCNQKHYSGYTFKELETLLMRLESIEGKFILSNYRSEMLDEYVERNGWNTREIEVTLSISNLGTKRKKTIDRRTEVLVYNYNLRPNLFTWMGDNT